MNWIFFLSLCSSSYSDSRLIYMRKSRGDILRNGEEKKSQFDILINFHSHFK